MGEDMGDEIVIRLCVARVYDNKGRLKKSLDYLGGIVDDKKIFID